MAETPDEAAIVEGTVTIELERFKEAEMNKITMDLCSTNGQ